MCKESPRAKDDADIAAEQEARFREEALWRAKQHQRLPRRGRCYNCGEPTEGVYCDVQCGKDYERQKAAERRNGC